MKAEIQFFSMPDDAGEILALVKNKIDTIEEGSRLLIGDCEVNYTSGTIKNNLLLMGSLAINTGPVDNACADQERAKAVYRKIRKWLKKNYSNRLNTYQLEGERKDAAERNHWLSPAAAEWVKAADGRLLKITENSMTAFEIMNVSNLMGEIKPVSSNKVRGHG
jgi:hypothetical protein